MAFTAVIIATAEKRVTGILNAGPDDGSYATSTADEGKYDDTEIRDAILEADAEICMAIISTLGHPYRSQYMTDVTGITYGQKLASRPGPLDTVEIQFADTIWHAGIPASSIDQIEKWKFNRSSKVNATTAQGRFFIDGDKFYYVGNSARILTPADFAIDYSTPACQAPSIYTPAVVSGAVTKLLKDGSSVSDLSQIYGQHFRDSILLIRAGEEGIAKLEQTLGVGK